MRGVAAIVFGVLAFLWPGVTLIALVVLYGAFALVDGLLALAAAWGGKDQTVPKWWLVLNGILGIGVGMITFFWPGITALVLILFIGVWALVRGIFEIVAAIQLRKQIEGEWLLVLAGLLSVAFGLGVVAFPGAGALALLWVIAIYAIAIGIVTVMLALKLRKHRSVVEGTVPEAAGKR
ncbi:MAG: HdeD family acid-resistance protein [Xanthobacteraceae bacterium]